MQGSVISIVALLSYYVCIYATAFKKCTCPKNGHILFSKVKLFHIFIS